MAGRTSSSQTPLTEASMFAHEASVQCVHARISIRSSQDGWVGVGVGWM